MSRVDTEELQRGGLYTRLPPTKPEELILLRVRERFKLIKEVDESQTRRTGTIRALLGGAKNMSGQAAPRVSLSTQGGSGRPTPAGPPSSRRQPPPPTSGTGPAPALSARNSVSGNK
jgi:hypothetical protein